MRTTKGAVSGRSLPLQCVVAALLIACGDPPRAGGGTTIEDRSSQAFSFPAPNLDGAELADHLLGDAAFEAVFVTAPAEVNPGLGPLFNNDACNACHLRDGRGLPVAGHGHQQTQLLVRVSLPAGNGVPEVPGGAIPVPGLGTQLADHAVFGHPAEATVTIAWEEVAGTYGDGTPFSLRRPVLEIVRTDGEPLPTELEISLRLPPPVFGLGLLEAVEEGALVALADPGDADGDGVSGRLNQVWDVVQQRAVVGRFGLKANNPTLLQQSAAAYANDMGITNPLFPGAEATEEVDRATLEAATFYVQTLAVPARADPGAPQVQRGEALFRSAGCARCHLETLHTGEHPIAALRGQEIHPYTDLLLHDMGEGLADGRPDFEATGTEWRTPPLWGIGLTQTVLPYSSYLHDGRARDLAEAILWHGGEAHSSREAFREMSAAERGTLLRFLESL